MSDITRNHLNGTNGNGHENGSPSVIRTVRNASAESMGFVVAEGVSLAVGMGVMAVADALTFGGLDVVSKAVSKVTVEPFLEKIEWAKDKLCKLEECGVDYSKPRQQRAEELTKTLLSFGLAWGASMQAKLWTRTKMNHLMGLPHEEELSLLGLILHPIQSYNKNPKAFRIVAADELVHYGSLILMNTGMAKVTDDYIRTTSNILHKTGLMSEKKAHELATYGLVWEAPNILGLGAGMMAIAHNHAMDHYSHAQRLEHSRLISGLATHTPNHP